MVQIVPSPDSGNLKHHFISFTGMENSLFLLAAVALVAAMAIFLIIRFSKRESRGENLIRFALVCVGLSAVFTLISAWISGEKAQLYKLSGPALILIIVLATRRRKKNSQN